MKNTGNYIIIFILLVLMVLTIFWNTIDEGFISLGLTQVKAPSWFLPKTTYTKNKSESKMYLDRYPWKNAPFTEKAFEEANEKASAYRLWRM